MSTNEDIKKLCILSRLQMDDYELGQTADKIKEIISFFTKLDEFDLSEDRDNSMLDNNKSKDQISNANKIANNFIRSEKKLEDLREDVSNKIVLDNIELANNSNNNLNVYIQQFKFTFRYQKNGFVIGPKI